MSRYRKIDSRIWYDEKFRRLSPPAQRFYLYLLTSPHSTAWGAYVLDDLYIQADLGLTPRQIEACWKELANWKLTVRCNTTKIVAFPNWFRYNRPRNKKSVSACLRGLQDLPRSPVLRDFFQRSEWIRERLANGELTVSEQLADEQEQEQEQEQENIESSRMLSADSTSPPVVWEGTFFVVDEILWQKILADYPAIPDQAWLRRFLSKIDDYIRDNPRKYKRDMRGRVKSPSAIIRNWLERETIRPQPKTIEEKARERGLL